MWAETTQGLTFQHSSDKTRKKWKLSKQIKKHNYPSTKHKFFLKNNIQTHKNRNVIETTQTATLRQDFCRKKKQKNDRQFFLKKDPNFLPKDDKINEEQKMKNNDSRSPYRRRRWRSQRWREEVWE